ncbi:PepSY domain-containing protein [Halalkalibacterium halodurans]|uniref:BH0374 protein n=1 Tax=Halalkalibacterium halodurans (strain ATCC BAA-125 / DSM 18197 / FERM 7344 / JCM 9153 / C-125) TaxID=272558 RepID=Q9KFU7_HALH5|nr:PepSY domain-containing protein [Halalkalibacterium halodurans]MED4125133.1 PepSY domain-containing protein [Halalkalibacterium halodurans]MED4172837.1 PepSY domain-containing protein [Halalkalibacterium halodurans]BAB04093.1 BH0374 [Halalkalibacterium halodurans C-125]
MKRKRVMLIFVPLLLLFVGALCWLSFFNQDPSLASEAEVTELIQTQYEGSTIQSLTRQGTVYTVMIDHRLGIYELMLDGETRDVLSLQLITLHEEKGGDEEGPEEEPVSTMLTEEQAIAIAQQEVEGKVDDIELEEENGLHVYEIEIEVDDDTEATIVMNAYTGQILSVTWD